MKKSLSSIASHNSTLDLLMPGSSEPIGLRMEVLPPDHSEIKDLMRRILDRRRVLASKGRPVNTADDERASKELCLAAVVGWEWTDPDADWEGSQPSFSKAILKEMLERDWLRSQVDAFLGDDKNFF